MRAFEIVPAHGILNFCEVIKYTRFGGVLVRWENNGIVMNISKQNRESIIKDTPENRILAEEYLKVAKMEIFYAIEGKKLLNKMEGV
ncbi:MAG: hypothetical protein ACOYM0_01385 [Bacteroidales bacterium]